MSCKHRSSIVLQTRVVDDLKYRRRECRYCGHRWSTVEVEVEFGVGRGRSMAALKAKIDFTERQQKAIEELIDAFLMPEEN